MRPPKWLSRCLRRAIGISGEQRNKWLKDSLESFSAASSPEVKSFAGKPHGLFLEDYEKGKSYTTSSRTIGEGDVSHFAGLVGDFNALHVDEEFAKTTIHGERIAHGPFIMSCAIGQLVQLGLIERTVIGLMNVNFDMTAPVRIGDTVHTEITVLEARRTSKKTTGVVTFQLDVRNQNNLRVQLGTMTVLVHARSRG